MSRQIRRTPIESFGPELLKALLEGGKRKIEFTTTYRTAIHFRDRIHKLREQMRLQKHTMYHIAARARVQILWGPAGGFPEEPFRLTSRKVKFPNNPNCPTRVIISPHDSQFESLLAQGGVRLEESDPTPHQEGTPPSVPESPEDMLAELLNRKDEP